MAITSKDIDEQSFSVERKGYSIEEVDVFLETVSNEVGALNNKIAELEKGAADKSGASNEEVSELNATIARQNAEIEKLKKEVAEKINDGKAISEALIVAQRQAMYNNVVTRKQLEKEEKEEGHVCHVGGIAEEVTDKKHRVPCPEQRPEVRAHNFDEVCLGYTAEMAVQEAQRCLNCKNPQCVAHCPVNVNIPGFIARVARGDFEGAAGVISCDSALPAVCGRVYRGWSARWCLYDRGRFLPLTYIAD